MHKILLSLFFVIMISSCTKNVSTNEVYWVGSGKVITTPTDWPPISETVSR